MALVASYGGWMSRAAIFLLWFSASAWADGDVDRGAKLYQGSCSACHGPNADGNGPAAARMKPRPANFSTPEFWKGRTDKQVAISIKSGSPGTPMIPFAHLNSQQVDDLVAYLRSRAPVPDGEETAPPSPPQPVAPESP